MLNFLRFVSDLRLQAELSVLLVAHCPPRFDWNCGDDVCHQSNLRCDLVVPLPVVGRSPAPEVAPVQLGLDFASSHLPPGESLFLITWL